MKKFLCIMMCLIMFMTPVLTGCSNNTETAETDAVADTEVVRYPMTLSLWLPTDENTSEEAIKLVEAELNKFTTSKYDTAIELHAISAAEYQAKIDAKLTSIDDVKKAAIRAEEEKEQQRVENAIAGIVPETTAEPEEETVTEVVTAETTVDEYGQSVTVYPEVADDQMDIFLVKGYDQYKSYIDEGLIEMLNNEMSDIGKKLNSYIYPHFLEMADVDGLYGVPNNHALGEYQFLLVNKRLVNEWSYSADELDSLRKCEDFIKDMANLKSSGEASLAGVTPLLGEAEAANMIYFNGDGNFNIGGEWSLICSQITADTASITNFDDFIPTRTIGSEYTAIVGMMKRLKDLDCIGDGVIDNGEEFAVGVVKGNHEDIAKYEEDYHVFIHGVPVATEEDVFESVFCVSKYTKDISRSMEIITYLNTNEDVRTILQYGVEGYHWEKETNADGEEVIDILRDDYVMNIVDTGNVYLTYPGEGIPKSYWEHSKQQNIDCAMNPYFGFEYVTEDNMKNFETLKRLSETYLNKINSLSADEFTAELPSLQKELVLNTTVSGLISKEANDVVFDTIAMQLDRFLK